MQPLGKRALAWLTIGLGVVSVLALWFIFQLRYVWYLQPDRLTILQAGFGIAVALLVLLWWLYPSRALVALVGFASLFFPPVIDQRYVGFTLGFLPFVLLIIGLLVSTAQLRRMQQQRNDPRSK